MIIESTLEGPESILLGMSCPKVFQVMDGESGKNIVETRGVSLEKNGKIKNFYMRDQANLLVQFEDLSLHMIESEGGKNLGKYHISWSSEQAMSEIKQLELLKANAQATDQGLSYLKTMD